MKIIHVSPLIDLVHFSWLRHEREWIFPCPMHRKLRYFSNGIRRKKENWLSVFFRIPNDVVRCWSERESLGFLVAANASREFASRTSVFFSRWHTKLFANLLFINVEVFVLFFATIAAWGNGGGVGHTHAHTLYWHRQCFFSFLLLLLHLIRRVRR